MSRDKFLSGDTSINILLPKDKVIEYLEHYENIMPTWNNIDRSVIKHAILILKAS